MVVWPALSHDQITAVSGGLAGTLAAVAVCPLDVAKTKLQAAHTHPPRYRGMLGTLRQILRESGVRGLYQGLVPVMLGYIPTWSIYFFIYERCKRTLSTCTLYAHPNPSAVHVTCALCAGLASTLATNPVWVVKTRLMSQSVTCRWRYKGTWDAFRSMYKREGLAVFYSGLGPALLGLTHVGIQFPVYEYVKARVSVDHGPDPAPVPSTSTLGILTASVTSKIVASSATYPHEVLRTRHQIRPRPHGRANCGLVQSVQTILANEGWRALYRGMGINLVRAVPASAVTLLTYEYVSALLAG